MFNFSQFTHESHDTIQETLDWFDIEGLSLEYTINGWEIRDSATNAMYAVFDYAWEVRDYINSINEECFCDGSDDAPYTCTFPPCVAEREAADFSINGFFATNPVAWLDPYDRNDPKHPDYADSIIDRIDEGRI